MSAFQLLFLILVALFGAVILFFLKSSGEYADIFSHMNIYIKPSKAEMNEFNSKHYMQFCDALYYSVVNCYKQAGLMYPYNANRQMFAFNNGKRIDWKRGMGVIFLLKVQRDIVKGGMKNPGYSKTPLDVIQNSLNQYFLNYCCDLGLPPYAIVKCVEGEKGTIKIYIACQK